MAVYRVPLALITLGAIVVQFTHGQEQANFSPLNFFSFFTIWSNGFAIAVLLIASAVRPSRDLDVFRGAAVLCTTIVLIVFALLLRNADSDVIPWVNTILHYVAPIGMILDWILDPPLNMTTVGDLLSWLVFPFAYILYTLLRGTYVNWYPYHFLNPNIVGYTGIGVYLAGIFVLTIGVAIALLTIANNRSPHFETYYNT